MHRPTFSFFIQEVDINARRMHRANVAQEIAPNLRLNYVFAREFVELTQGTKATRRVVVRQLSRGECRARCSHARYPCASAARAGRHIDGPMCGAQCSQIRDVSKTGSGLRTIIRIRLTLHDRKAGRNRRNPRALIARLAPKRQKPQHFSILTSASSKLEPASRGSVFHLF